MTDFEAQVQLAESFEPASPAAQDLEEFEAYNRRALPQLVEANLQAMVNTEMVPIAENLRRLLVDVVRRCQSTVGENFRVTRVRRRISGNSPQPSSPNPIPPSPLREEASLTNSQLLHPIMGDTASAFFEEPPHVSVEAGPSCPRPPEDTDCLEPFQNRFTDSGYGSSLEACDCDCHVDVGTDFSINGLFAPWQFVVSALTGNRQTQGIVKTALSSTLMHGDSALGT